MDEPEDSTNRLLCDESAAEVWSDPRTETRAMAAECSLSGKVLELDFFARKKGFWGGLRRRGGRLGRTGLRRFAWCRCWMRMGMISVD